MNLNFSKMEKRKIDYKKLKRIVNTIKKEKVGFQRNNLGLNALT